MQWDNHDSATGILRNIITTLGRILLFLLIALLTFISVFINVINPFYYKRVFKKINRKVSRLMNPFLTETSGEYITDKMGEYFGVMIVFAGMVMLLLSLKSC